MPRDKDLLRDIVSVAEKLQDITAQKTLDEFLADELTLHATERLFEIIGEASRRLSADIKQAHPEIPWHKMIAMRNRIAHEYEMVNYERMWRIMTSEIPNLLASLNRIINGL